MEDEGVDQGQDRTSESTFEGAPSASGLHASPSPTTTTLPTPDPAAATYTPITTHLWLRAQALLVCLPTLPMVWTHLSLRFQRQLLPVSQWPPVLRRAGMRQTIIILYPLREPMWMFLVMQPWVGWGEALSHAGAGVEDRGDPPTGVMGVCP